MTRLRAWLRTADVAQPLPLALTIFGIAGIVWVVVRLAEP